MLDYIKKPDGVLKKDNLEIPYFNSLEESNKDEKVIEDFGEEWLKFSSFSKEDLSIIGDAYFLLTEDLDRKNMNVLDIGCGTGRWAYYLSSKVKSIEAIDPSLAVYSAAKMLKDKQNVRVTRCELDAIPFTPGTFDLVYSLGVLHHIPDTNKAIEKAVSFVKPNGYFLVYLYYSVANRGFLFKSIFHITNVFRRVISILPSMLKKFVCDIIALLIYLPIVTIGRILLKLAPNSKLVKKIPLIVYSENKSSFQILRNDSLDRFGTQLEQRFTRQEIFDMLDKSGLKEIKFAESGAKWVAIGKK